MRDPALPLSSVILRRASAACLLALSTLLGAAACGAPPPPVDASRAPPKPEPQKPVCDVPQPDAALSVDDLAKDPVIRDLTGKIEANANDAVSRYKRGKVYANKRAYALAMQDFDAVVRLTEALLPTLRASAPSAVVNVASTAGRVARPRTGAYSASKFALIGWTDSLHLEEKASGVHVGLVLPGFIATEGFPATELREKALTRWMVSKPELVAEAILDAGPGGKAERYVPRPYALAAMARMLVPGLTRRVLAGGAGTLTTSTAEEKDEAAGPT